MRGFAPARRGSFARPVHFVQGKLRTGSFVSAKGPKTIGARAWPPEKPKVVILNAVKNLFFVGSRSLIESSFAPLPSAPLPSATLLSASLPSTSLLSATLPSATLRTSRAGRTGRTGAALRQSSPPYGMDGTGAPPRPQVPGQRQRTTTLDPRACPEHSRRVRKDDREKCKDDGGKRKGDGLFLSCPA